MSAPYDPFDPNTSSTGQSEPTVPDFAAISETPWFRRRSVLVAWLGLIAAMLALVVWGIIQLTSQEPSGGDTVPADQSSSTVSSTSDTANTTSTSASPTSSDQSPADQVPSDQTGSPQPPAQQSPQTSDQSPHHLPHLPSVITIPPVPKLPELPTVITLPHR